MEADNQILLEIKYLDCDLGFDVYFCIGTLCQQGAHRFEGRKGAVVGRSRCYHLSKGWDAESLEHCYFLMWGRGGLIPENMPADPTTTHLALRKLWGNKHVPDTCPTWKRTNWSI